MDNPHKAKLRGPELRPMLALAAVLIVQATLGLVLLAWLLLGRPREHLADWLWGDTAAPWETVDAVVYPEGYGPAIGQAAEGFASVEACERWARTIAAPFDLAATTAGCYRCRIGSADPHLGVMRYRREVQPSRS